MSGSALRSLVVEDKTGLYPMRLISILALTWLCVRLVRFDAGWLRSGWAGPLVLVGQNSLPVFCSGIVIGFLARLGLEYDDQAAMQVGINLMGGLGMLGVGALAAWYRTKGKAKGSENESTVVVKLNDRSLVMPASESQLKQCIKDLNDPQTEKASKKKKKKVSAAGKKRTTPARTRR